MPYGLNPLRRSTRRDGRFSRSVDASARCNPLALHRVFDSPRDRLLWDVGHQAYVHRIVTGRAGEFTGPRRRGSLSGYPSREESAHDHIEHSHASAALSYADGMAKAGAFAGETDRHIVAVVGDGALTGRLAWEARGCVPRTGSRSPWWTRCGSAASR